MTKTGFWNYLIGAIGYILSPLSWWNDAFVNLPIAYLLASFLSLLNRSLFTPGIVIGYWLTNLLGIALMSLATVRLGRKRTTGPRQFFLNLLVAASYTLLVVTLVHFRLLKPFWAYRH